MVDDEGWKASKGNIFILKIKKSYSNINDVNILYNLIHYDYDVLNRYGL